MDYDSRQIKGQVLSYVGIISVNRNWEQTREWIREQNASRPFLRIVMPCGVVYQYNKEEDLPQESVQCACGNPCHWVILYERRFYG